MVERPPQHVRCTQTRPGKAAHLLVQLVVQVAVISCRRGTFQQPAEHADAPHPVHLLRAPRLLRSLALTCKAASLSHIDSCQTGAFRETRVVMVAMLAWRAAANMQLHKASEPASGHSPQSKR